MFGRVKEDVATVFAKDPAARSVWEVLTCYPGVHAIWLHRLANCLWRHRILLLGRLVSHLGRWLTGVDIHPGAKIGRRFFIDHGMGVVIGETAEIGDDVLMYQGAVLGGTSLEKKKRHPTIGSGAVIGAGATILGPISVGDGARIGAGSVVIKPVPAGATVVGVPGHIAGPEPHQLPRDVLQHGRLPDPVLRVLSETLDRQARLEERVGQLENAQPDRLLPAETASDGGHPVDEGAVRRVLQEIIDPEVGVNIVDLGLVSKITCNGAGVEVSLVMTSPACPMVGYFIEQVRRKVRSATGGCEVKVTILDQAWSWNHTQRGLAWGDGI